MGANPLLKKEKNIVFFDTSCLLCSRFVNILLKYDKGKLYYSGFEGEAAAELLPKRLLLEPQSIVVSQQGLLYYRSKAIFYIIKQLGFPWTLLNLFRIFPRYINDGLYNLVSRNRYVWFGKSDTCYLPTEEQKSKFID